MSEEIERSIRAKIVDLQIFLRSGKVTEAALLEIDLRLDPVLEIVDPSRKIGDTKCEA
jgi:hypothetical protein